MSQTDCDGKSLGSGDVQTTLQNNGMGYVFKKSTDNQDFYFSNIETPTSGVFSGVCSGTVNSTTTRNAQEIIFLNTANISSTDCPTVFGEVCAYIEIGQDIGNNNAKIHTKEWIRVRTNTTQGKVGFFTFRKRVSRSYCGENQAQVTEAVLKQ